METPLVNRIAKSKLITVNPDKHFPTHLVAFDLKDFLFQGLILKEKEFRSALDEYDWQALTDRPVHIGCSSEAIIPLWAYMLVASKASPYAASIQSGSKADFISTLIVSSIKKELESTVLENGKFVIKGCSINDISPNVYSELTSYLTKQGAKSIMFGEPCSTVPIYKKPKK